MKVGEIVCDYDLPSHLKAIMQLSEGGEVRAGQFVEIRDDKKGLVYIGEVVKPHIFNPYYADKRLVQETMHQGDTRMLLPAGDSWNVRTAIVEIMGVLSDGTVELTGFVPEPGSEVHSPTPARLSEFFGYPSDGLEIGRLHNHKDVDVKVDPGMLLFHEAVLGTTGSGKSYGTGVLIEELHRKGFPTIVIDPHGEYRSLAEAGGEGEEPCHVLEFSPPSFHLKGTRIISLRPDDLSGDDLIELAGLSGDQQKNLVYLALRNLRARKERYGLQDMVDAIQSTSDERRFRQDTADSVVNRIMSLEELGILGEGFDPNELLSTEYVSVINLSGIETVAERILVAAVLRKLFSGRKLGLVPSFICVVEEAHRYAPDGLSTVSKSALSSMVKEGRKFGVGLVAVSQSPKDLDVDILKLCNSRLIFRLDNPLDLTAIRPYVGMLPDEVLNELPFFPAGRAILSGLMTRFPGVIDIRRRHTKHGGETAMSRTVIAEDLRQPAGSIPQKTEPEAIDVAMVTELIKDHASDLEAGETDTEIFVRTRHWIDTELWRKLSLRLQRHGFEWTKAGQSSRWVRKKAAEAP